MISFALAVLAATAGNLVGSLIAYGVGATGRMQRVPFVGAVLALCDGLFERHGARAVFIARLVPLARTLVLCPQEHGERRCSPFIVLTTAGCALWASLSC